MAVIDLYSGFDPAFFQVRPKATEQAKIRQEEHSIAERYERLITENRQVLDDVLSHRKPLYEIARAVYSELLELSRYEIRPSIKIGKDTDIGPLNEQLGLESLTQAQERYLAGRVRSHISRLVCEAENLAIDKDYNRIIMPAGKDLIGNHEIVPIDAGYARRFAIDLVDGFDALFERDEPFQRHVEDALHNDYADSILWTFLPYVHVDLKERGLSSGESISLLFGWLDAIGKQSPRGQPSGRWYPFLPETCYGKDFSDHILGYDQRMPSHLFARIMSQPVGEDLIGFEDY